VNAQRPSTISDAHEGRAVPPTYAGISEQEPFGLFRSNGGLSERFPKRDQRPQTEIGCGLRFAFGRFRPGTLALTGRGLDVAPGMQRLPAALSDTGPAASPNAFRLG
jgi:hypothetical protein